MSYTPLYIKGMEAGLVQSRQQFILPDDAYPVLENAFVWREQLKRKQGNTLLGRLRRKLTTQSIGNITTAIGSNTIDLFTLLGVAANEPNAEIELGSITTISIAFGAPLSQTLTINTATNVMTIAPAGTITAASINYSTGIITYTASGVVGPSAATFTGAYYPNLPVMGLRGRELNSINVEQTIAFDTIYAYRFATGWQEWIPSVSTPGTNRWTGSDSDFFWTTNYWVGDANLKIFWITNSSGTGGDPIRYSNGNDIIDFAPQINAAGDNLTQCLAMLPFRGRLVAFNTLEGPLLNNSTNYSNRIRWAAIGNPFTTVSAIVTTVSADAWRDDIRGKGGYLDIPTSEAIVAVGFVRDNLVIYCERSTWQLRYTGRSIAPFQIEKINSELGSESTFSAIQFDTSLVGIGDKGVVECDSYKSNRIDTKIPDLVYEFKNEEDGTKRVYGIRDIQQKLAYWTYNYNPIDRHSEKFPNRVLVYNYENDSWSIFTDSYTCFGNFQNPTQRTWATSTFAWSVANFPWFDIPAQFPNIVAGNQQGFVMDLSSNLDPQLGNESTLYIQGIQGAGALGPTVITSPDHNLEDGQVVQIVGLLAIDPFFASLNNEIFGVVVIDKDTFELWIYNSQSNQFSTPTNDSAAFVYTGGASIVIRDNFKIQSKKFNFLDDGQNIQMGFIDILMAATSEGAISLNVYLDYNNDSPINQLPQNANSDTFFNQVVPTTISKPNGLAGSKYWQRVYCPSRGAFLTIEWTLSNLQMIGVEQESEVQIDSQILWLRKAGRQLPTGV